MAILDNGRWLYRTNETPNVMYIMLTWRTLQITW